MESRRRSSGEACAGRSSIVDDEGFGRFYADHLPSVVAYIGSRARDESLTEDLVSSTFAAAFEHRAEFRGTSTGQERAWVLMIARTQLHRYYRRLASERQLVETLEQAAPAEASFAEPFALERLAEALAALPTDQRAAIAARILADQDYPTIAASLGVSEAVVRARVSRGLRTLARERALNDES